MNRNRAKQLLMLHRPGSDGDSDPELAEALHFMEHDEELRRWFDAQRARQEAIRRALQNITPPVALKEQILAERPWHTRPATARHLITIIAAAVLLCSLGLWWTTRPPQEDMSFASYRSRMVSMALRSYSMELETNNLASIQSYLERHAAPNAFSMPAGLAQATTTGCLTVPWNGGKASMICFKTGRELSPGQSSDLWLFVIPRSAVRDAPTSESPQFAIVNSVATATWTHEGDTYVLAVDGDETLLKQFL